MQTAWESDTYLWRYFEIKIKTEIIKPNLFLKSMHIHTQLTNVILFYYAYIHFMGLINELYTSTRHNGNKPIPTVC